MTKKEIKLFKQICRFNQKNLKASLAYTLKSKYKEVVSEDGFLYAAGSFPVLLVAHMDTVHRELPKGFVQENGCLSSPQGIGGDDRCGIYIILKCIKQFDCSVVFTEDEEIGGIGADAFARYAYENDLSFNYIVELDRRGSNDAVFYDCDNKAFAQFITKTGDYKTNYGSYSDICDIAPAVGAAAVNLSCGYYNAHTKDEYVVLSEMESSLKNLCSLLARTTKDDVFEYVKAKDHFSLCGSRGSIDYRYSYYEDWDMFTQMYEDNSLDYYITFNDGPRGENIFSTSALTECEAVGEFLMKFPDRCFNDVIDILTDDPRSL